MNSAVGGLIDEDKESTSILGIVLGLVGGLVGFVSILFSYSYLRKSMRMLNWIFLGLIPSVPMK